jgi:HD-GYP domain-containing protein (c-di-GMP phosphodiesterase class II)
MQQLILHLASAVNTRALYPANHPRVVKAVDELVASVERAAAAKKSDSVTLLVVADDLVADQEVLRKTTLTHLQLRELLQRRGVERLTLAIGIDVGEANRLVAALATGESIESTPHVIVGKVKFSAEQQHEIDAQREISVEDIDIVRESFARFRIEKKLPVAVMEKLVWSFIDSMSRTTRFILPLAKLKEHDEYTFVHCVNVSLLVLAQARAFGIQGPMLHSFGMAGLLHDIGKLTIPLTVLNKPGKLEGEDWAVMQSHAEQGSWYLSEMEGTLPLTAVVAFEHHLRYDGQASYPILKKPRVPNLASRMTSIADAYDAMSTVRPYQKPLMRTSALDILRKRAETFYDPLLVANFVQLVGDSPAAVAS